MVRGYLEFKANCENWSDEISFQVIASYENFKFEDSFYGDKESFKEFAQELINFPKSLNQVIKFDAGKEEIGWAGYLMIKVYCFDASGHPAIEVLSVSNSEPPYNHRINFHLISEVASINKLGKALLDWNPRETETLLWENITN